MTIKTPPLFLHQIRSLEFLRERPSALDASDPGTGKTRVQIELFAARRARGAGAALIIAPKSLLRSAWEDDFSKYAPWLKVSVAFASNREEAFQKDADVYITNTDGVNWLAKQKPSFFTKLGLETLVVDELSAFKHHTSARSKSLAKLRKYFKYRYGLTGTPDANTITDLWHQFFVLDDGKRLGTSFYQFRASVCQPQQVGPQPQMVKWIDKEGAELAVSGLIKDITIRHKFEECVDIPENHQYTMQYHMSKIQAAKYEQMTELAVTSINRQVINAVNAAAVMTKLMQIASGAVYDESGSYAEVEKGRYELVADLVQQRNHSVVFFNWKHQRNLLIEEFKARGITFALIDSSVSDKERASAVELFQKGFYKVLLAHPQSAAHGLTLTRGTTTIWSSPTYNLEHFLQGNKRIYRISQTQPTETITLLAAGTIEEKVYEKLMTKDVRQASLLSMLQEYRDELEHAGADKTREHSND